MKARWIAAILLASLVVLAGAGIGVVSWRSAEKLVHPAREQAGETPALPFEAVAFASADGVRLAGWWIPAAPAEVRGTVIFLHGYGDSKDQVLPLVPFLHDAGYHVLAFDFRAHGQSEGDETTVGLVEVDDVRGALAFVAQKDRAAYEHVALLGYSMGAAAAINTAAIDESVDVAIADSAFATLENIASNSITAFTDLPKYPFGPLSVVFAGWMVGKDVSENAPVEAIRSAMAPTLVIQGLDDTIAYPAEDGEAIAREAPPGSRLWLVPGAAHVQAHAIAPQEYESRVLTFLEANLR